MSGLYGDGSDGTVHITSNIDNDFGDNYNGIIQANEFQIDSGVTVDTVHNNYLGNIIIQATEYIDIRGTLRAKSGYADAADDYYIGDAAGVGGDGGAEGGGNGENGTYARAGGGGGGTPDAPGDPGETPADANTTLPSEPQSGPEAEDTYLGGKAGWSELYNFAAGAGIRGGSGGDSGNLNGDRINGGHSGDGGGYIILAAPEVNVSGTVDASGQNGGDGRIDEDEYGQETAGGGGGAGSGGIIWIVSPDRNVSGTTSISGAVGGTGADSSTDGEGDGGDGADSGAGVQYNLAVDLLAPTSLSSDLQPNSDIELAWSQPSDGANNTEVYRSESSGVTTSDTLLGTVDGSTTTFTDTTTSIGGSYYYAVRNTAPDGSPVMGNEIKQNMAGAAWAMKNGVMQTNNGVINTL